MRKFIWTMLMLMFVAIAAPNARADSVTATFSGVVTGTATFTVTPESGGTFLVTSVTGSITSPYSATGLMVFAVDAFDDNTNIINSLTSFSGNVAFFDTTYGVGWYLYTNSDGDVLVDAGPECAYLTGCNTIGAETVTLSPVTTSPTTTPEPSAPALVLLGVGLLFLMRKRMGLALTQAS